MRFGIIALLLFTAVLFCTITPLFSQESDEWYQGKPINNIVFTGLRNISNSELEALMQPYKGRNFNETVFIEIQNRLYSLEYFDRIEPTVTRADAAGSEVIIRFNVTERPVVSRINFAGNSGVRRNELLETISTKVNDVYNQAKIRMDVEAITNKYIEKGYPNATVTVDEVQTGESNLTVTFRIIERDKISISRIEFQGNTRFSTSTLRSQLSLKSKSLLQDGAFQEAKLIADREAVTKYYRDRGFIEAIVRDVTRTYDTDSKGTNLILTFLIDEGVEFRFGGVAFEGNIIFSSEQLQKLISSKVGEIVNDTRLEMDLQSVADLYFENGYIYNTITRTPEKNYQTNVISYTVSIIERNRAYIESISVVGNNKTKPHVILREIPLEPGDVFSKTKVMNALQNLYNLQYFSVIIPDTRQGSTENLMDLVFTVEEQPTTDLQFGLTFSGSADPDTFPISGMVKWNDRNFIGSGNEFGAEINSSIVDTHSFSINYLHRWVFGLPLSLGVDFTANYTSRLAAMANPESDDFPYGFKSKQEYEDYSKNPPREYMMDYSQWYLSIGFSSGYRWATFAGTLGVGAGIRFGIVRNSYDATYFTPFDEALSERNNEWRPKNSYWMSVSLDKRDIFYDPSRGFYLLERLGFYGIFSGEREHYVKSDSKAQYFLTLFDLPVTEKWNFKSVLALHLGYSFIFKQPGRELVIEDANMLAVDGMFTGRGWSGEYKYKGYMLLDSWVELRFPIVRGILAWDFFFDMAGVETEKGYYFGRYRGERNFTVENMRFSYGGGLRFTMPQFPIRISVARIFRIIDGNVTWGGGELFGVKGMNLVISFVMSY
jgi:outer membrane protein insertion porin family